MKSFAKMIYLTAAFAAIIFGASAPSLLADASSKLLFDFKSADNEAFVGATDESEMDVATAVGTEGLDVTIAANGKSGFPGIKITPPEPWDASGYGRLEVWVTNTGADPLRLNMRIENDAHWSEEAWSGNAVVILPGETKVLPVVFGFQYGKQAYALQPEAIKRASIFTGKSALEQSFRLETIIATVSGDGSPKE